MRKQSSSVRRNIFPLAPRGICAKEKKRNILEVFHHLEARQEVNAMPLEQACIHKHEVRFAKAQEF
jgi:hypothetical protein